MKKPAYVLFVFCLIIFLLCGCSSDSENNANQTPASEKSQIELVEEQLQGTWIQTVAQPNPDGEKVEFVFSFADGVLSADTIIGGESINNTKVGSYVVEADGIHTRTPRSKDSSEYLDGNIPYTFKNGILSLTPPEGSTITKLEDGSSIQIESNGASNSDNRDSSKSESKGSGSPSSSTMGDNQALKKALQYLDYTAFSYSGLVDQLEYEGFSHSEAVYGADNCGADWNEQAAKKAQEYLDFTSFSRQELISQLEYEGFTHQQAEYGVKAVGY